MPLDPVSRRAFLATSGGLLASLTLPSLPSEAAAPAVPSTDLARYRPVRASSSAYAATPPEFVVDGLAVPGVRGSGWRAAGGDPQWIVVDLQGRCRVDAVRLTFEATAQDPAFDFSGGNPYGNTTGQELLSSSPLDFRVDTSTDGASWHTVHQATNSPGGTVDIALDSPVTAQYVRLTGTRQANANALGVNGLQVWGTTTASRPPATGWTDWSRHTDKPPSLRKADDGTFPIESGWTLTMDDFAGTTDGAVLAQPGRDTSTWLPATVPGTVLGSLVEQGHLPDPVEGMNNLEIPEALSRHAWWYHRKFDRPAGNGSRVWLEFDGINHQGDVWLNGTQVGTVKHPFARAAFDVTAVLKAKNALAVKITPMPHPGTAGDKGDSGQSFVQSATLYLDSPTLLAASGWDWMPAVRDRAAGIWNHVRLRFTGDVVVGDPRVVTRVPSVDRATVAVTVPVRNAADAPRTVTVKAQFSGRTASKSITMPAGASTDVAFDTETIDEPDLWWPNGCGEPTLHELTVTASVGGVVSDSRATTFGIREFGYDYDLPIVIDPATNSAAQTVTFSKQTAQYLRIQGRRRATGWGYSLWTLAIRDSSDPSVDLARAGTATASSDDGSPAAQAIDGNDRTRWSSQYDDDEWIQVDLGAPKAFDRVELLWETAYAALFTIQVSQDGATWTDVEDVSNAPVPLKISVNGVRVFCRGGNWGWDELLRRMPEERLRAVIGMHRDMNFTMIRNWIGSSTREEFYQACDENGILVWNDFWEAGPFTDDLPGYAEIARDTIVRYRTHPCIVIWCGANEENPPAAIDAAITAAVREEDDEILYLPNSAAGFVSGHGPYYWVDPVKYFDPNTYDTFNFGFHTEIGMPTIPVVESMRNLVGDGDPGWPIGTPWYHHDWSMHGNQRPDTYLGAIDERLGSSSGLEEFTRKAQFVNYENMRAMFEAWNAHLWTDASALLLWMSHPAWHSTVWQTYDYDLDVNGSYYGARKGCEAIHVQANQTDWTTVVVNHTRNSVTATVEADLYDLAGNLLATSNQAVTVEGSNKREAFAVAFGAELPDLHILRLKLTGANGVLSENTYWRYRKPADMQELNELPKARLEVRSSGRNSTVRNTGTVVAAMVRVSLRDRAGERVLPATYSDNYFWLLPGETRTITVTTPSSASGTRLEAEPYNN
ncbi:glycosyl hydrolase family 2 [Kribbella rubisoli]|uniref:Glycosyl hydrolase family 2 n=1 Tax=Kribbella rubisoli TaxID=3075929 RepID=A0A4Q7X7K0_9ACTN|nr:discoidin domain-containing protein [Kribbella rubisoli]RZU19080.1 glycosyl hydrolase family 2 [Kribbella rubisoli]